MDRPIENLVIIITIRTFGAIVSACGIADQVTYTKRKKMEDQIKLRQEILSALMSQKGLSLYHHISRLGSRYFCCNHNDRNDLSLIVLNNDRPCYTL